METKQPIVLNDALWDKMFAITKGAMMACYQCGTCTAVCPWSEVRGEPLNVRSLLHSAQIGVCAGDLNGNGDIANSDLWLCTTCKQCETRCPRTVNIVDSILALREVAFESRYVPPQIEQTLWGILEDGNPWGGQSAARAQWAEGLNIKSAKEGVEVLLFVCCSVAYDTRLQRIARSLAKILQAAGIDFGILGQEERCCGDIVHASGEDEYLKEIIAANIADFAETGATTILTVSPHCFHTYKYVYPKYGAELPVKHHTDYLAELIEDGRLQLKTPLEQSITYHDPCFLSCRYEDVCDPSRQVLDAIPSLELVEMESIQESTLCCGGGGGRMWLETEKGERLSDLRVEQAQATSTESMVTACPFCIQNFEDSFKTSAVNNNMSVIDLAELVVQAL